MSTKIVYCELVKVPHSDVAGAYKPLIELILPKNTNFNQLFARLDEIYNTYPAED